MITLSVAALLCVEKRGGWVFGVFLENPKPGEHNYVTGILA
ncbi:hypothetical protein QUA54_11990 [Microcoleus sp. MOSTC5]